MKKFVVSHMKDKTIVWDKGVEGYYESKYLKIYFDKNNFTIAGTYVPICFNDIGISNIKLYFLKRRIEKNFLNSEKIKKENNILRIFDGFLSSNTDINRDEKLKKLGI